MGSELMIVASFRFDRNWSQPFQSNDHCCTVKMVFHTTRCLLIQGNEVNSSNKSNNSLFSLIQNTLSRGNFVYVWTLKSIKKHPPFVCLCVFPPLKPWLVWRISKHSSQDASQNSSPLFWGWLLSELCTPTETIKRLDDYRTSRKADSL